MAQIARNVADQRLIVAHAANLPAFQEPEQLGLHRLGQFADLVEKERAAVGHLEEAGPVPLRAGEGPFAMSEELAFDEVFRQRAAVDRHERHFRREGFDRARPARQAPAGARFAPIKTVELVGAALAIMRRTVSMPGELPTSCDDPSGDPAAA